MLSVPGKTGPALAEGGSAGARAISFSIDGVTDPSAPASKFSAGTGSPNTIRPPAPIRTPIGRVTACAAPPANVDQFHVA